MAHSFAALRSKRSNMRTDRCYYYYLLSKLNSNQLSSAFISLHQPSSTLIIGHRRSGCRNLSENPICFWDSFSCSFSLYHCPHLYFLCVFTVALVPSQLHWPRDALSKRRPGHLWEVALASGVLPATALTELSTVRISPAREFTL